MLKGLIGAAACAIVLGACATVPAAATGAGQPRPNVTYAGPLEASGERALYQGLILDLASVWANCDADLMRRTLSEDVDFSYPTNHIIGIDRALGDLASFCAVAVERSIYFPADAFYIDTQNNRVAAEVQFRVTQEGKRQVVNDVWIATVRDGRIAIIKEYLDGRVKQLQAEGVLTYGEDAPFLTPWPPRAAAPPAASGQ
ncbi:MAG: nuclear transport factor 2 family protein [Hyphomonadaceae bacterium]|nr:nuclear transport factor 2 family protein [Hyphomonadaceae bacterium]